MGRVLGLGPKCTRSPNSCAGCDLRLFLPSYFFQEQSDGHLILRISLLAPEIHFFPLDLKVWQDPSMMLLSSGK